jgi:hypothetical protein
MSTPGIKDVFRRIVSIVDHMPEENVTKARRSQIKMACFAATAVEEPALERFLGDGSFFERLFRELNMKPGALDPEAQGELVGLLECLWRRDISDAGWDMTHGVYEHFKEGVYLTTGVSRDADTGEPRVEYISLLHGSKHNRRAEQWREVVKWPDGRYRSRFVLAKDPVKLVRG